VAGAELAHPEERTTMLWTVQRGRQRQRGNKEENSNNVMVFLLWDIIVKYIHLCWRNKALQLPEMHVFIAGSLNHVSYSPEQFHLLVIFIIHVGL
jgi:hypothetical protein